MTLVKTSTLSFIATLIKMLAALVINNAFMVCIGYSCLALVGQFKKMLPSFQFREFEMLAQMSLCRQSYDL